MRRYDGAGDEQTEADTARGIRMFGLTTGERLEDEWHGLCGYGRAAVVNGEPHRPTFLMRGERDRCFATVLDTITNQVRHDLSKSISVPVADQVSSRLQPQDSIAVGCAN